VLNSFGENLESTVLAMPNFAVGQKSDPPKIRRLKSVLSEFVINYGLKSVAWFVFGCVTNCDPACKRVGVQACKRACVQGCIKVRSAECEPFKIFLSMPLALASG
jgi:hypothetical protein